MDTDHKSQTIGWLALGRNTLTEYKQTGVRTTPNVLCYLNINIHLDHYLAI